MPPGEPITPVRFTTPQTPIRLPGIAGEVLWQATTDNQGALQTLKLHYPNRHVDTFCFDATNGVSVTRRLNNETRSLTPSMTRQSLVHARIVSGLHLQLALEKAFGQDLDAKKISDDAIGKIAAKIASNGLDVVGSMGRTGAGAQNFRSRFASLVHSQISSGLNPSPLPSPLPSPQTMVAGIGQVAQNVTQPGARVSMPRA